ncbi:MAG TPA: LPS assembly protein LptD [Burkholderiales bacterium]|nr:LPS assembly protein LptD [Burkholderiales bacterium]
MLRPTARLAALLILLSGATLAWPQAPESTLVPAPGAVPKPAPAKAPKPVGPTTIDAEQIEGVSGLEVTARGRVEFQREDLSIYSEYLRYNREFGRVEADGGVRVQRGVDRFFGPRLRYNTQDDTGVFEEATFLIGENMPARGTAERIEFLSKDKMRLNQATYTTCKPGDDGWLIEAGEMELDNEAQEGKARDMRMRFLDTTVMALPYASFPLENSRKTGFLAPYYSQNSRRGLEIGTPFYLNIAPEQDLLLTPAYMTKRGEQLKGFYRYMGETYKGQLRGEYMPDDHVLDRPRSGYSFQHDQNLLPNLNLKIDVNKVSDDRYMVDFATSVHTISQGVLPREGVLTYSNTFFDMPSYLIARAQTFQTLQDPLAPIVTPYARVPQISFGTSKVNVAGLADVTLPGEYVRFASNSLVEGSRTQFNPSMSIPYNTPGYFVTPRFGVHTASYDLQNTAPGQSQRQAVTVPWTSLDGGLTFERGMTLLGQNLTQTLEPRVYYLYAPFRDQSQVPLFDTALADFNYAQLFSENRFSGGDRFGDANQLTLAATTRFLNERGQEQFRATLGQRYYFTNYQVALNSTTSTTPSPPPPIRGASDLLASVGGRFQAVTFDSTLQYNFDQARADRYGLAARYAPEIAKVVSATYRYNQDPSNPFRQMDIAGQWPVSAGWYAIGRYNYSFLDKTVVQALAGLEYNAGCWVFRGVVQRLQAATQTASTGAFFQIEFNGLGQVGAEDTAYFMSRNVPGYARTNPTDPQLVPQSLRPQLPFNQVF